MYKLFLYIFIKSIYFLFIKKKYKSGWVINKLVKNNFRISNTKRIVSKKINLTLKKKNEEIYPLF